MPVIVHDVSYFSRTTAALTAEISTNETSSAADSMLGVVALVFAMFGLTLVLTSLIRKRKPKPRTQTNQERNVDTYFDRIRTGKDTNGEFGIQPDAYLDKSDP